MIVIATWPLLLGLEARLGGRRGWAAGLLTLGLLLVLILPLSVAAGTVIEHLDEISGWLRSMRNQPIPAPPEWVGGLPLIGHKADATWRSLAAEGEDGLVARSAPYAGKMVEWVAGTLGGLGGMVIQFLMIVVISSLLYMQGEQAASAVLRFAQRLAGGRGVRAARLAAGAIRGVAMGVMVTALVQTVLAGAGLLIASVPAAGLLSSAILVLCLAQLGPTLVMLPAVIWKFQTGDTLMGGVLLVFALLSGSIDNVVRPAMIRKGADLPLVVIFAGVMGGMVSAGIMGIFVGPVILAVSHTLLKEWVNEMPAEDTVG
jgi:predicted PurR-regulated permease PerM